jgi:hypothetical protein
MSTFVELAKINVNAHTEKKNGLTYLSWAWAVDQLLRMDDTASWEYRFHEGRPYFQIGETCMVFCTVKAFGKERTAQLPVLDYKNKAIANPNAMEVNTAMQRCLAKAIALHGIGLYIYAGEDLPQGEDAPAGSTTTAGGIKAPNHQAVTKDVWDQMSEEVQNKLTDVAMVVIGHFDEGSDQKAFEYYEDEKSKLDADQQVALWSRFESKHRTALKALKKRWEEAEAKRKVA